jgi:hypothetical protein
MTSHGVKVAARNLAEMKSKEAHLADARAKEAVMEADRELTRQWNQLQAQADIIREASEAASAEARIWSDKLFYAEEELDESRRQLEGHLTPPDVDNSQFSRDWGPTLLSEIETIQEEPEFKSHLQLREKVNKRYGKWCLVFKDDKTRGFIIEKGGGEGVPQKEGLLRDPDPICPQLIEIRRGEGWHDSPRTRKPRYQFDLRGKNQEVLRDILRKVIE